jgi:hypothetical protein
MTNEPRWHPDLLRRFVATPYTFSKYDGANQICVESNDLEIALSVRRSGIVERQGRRAGGLRCKLIRDMTGPVDISEISIISDGTLQILCLGRGTILIHDPERSELLGFIAPNVKAKELVSSLIPALLSYKAKNDLF